MDPLDLHLLSELENGLPLVEEPYEEIGKRLNLTGNEVLERIQNLQVSGDYPEIPGTHQPEAGRYNRKCPGCMETCGFTE